MKKVALFLLGGAVFLWAILQLLETRFARGDVYPAYSTLRADPLGAKAFYESLAHLDRLSVSRNEKPLEQFSAQKNATLFCIGTTGLYASEKEITNLERFVKNGGRLVIAFYPQGKETFLVERKQKKTPSPTPSPGASPEEEAPFMKILSTAELAKRWEFKLDVKARLADSSAIQVNPVNVDPEISWHSAVHFKNSAPVWEIIYMASEFPVVIERQMGEGTIVLASDSYFLSNEAMRRERHAAFLAWLVDPGQQIVFDETHLGISEAPGISTLMRRYRLGGLIAGLVVLALLAVWKNATRLLPAAETERANDEIIAGKESFAGFVNLLRRNVAPSELLAICVEEWSKFLPHKSARSKTQIDRAREIVAQSPRNVAGAYQQISHAIHQTKWKPHQANSSTH